MKALLKNYLEYNFWANQLFIESFKDGYREEESIRLFSHLLNAHDTWLARIRGQEANYDSWEIHVVNSFQKVHEINHAGSMQLLDEESSLERIISYQNSKGAAFENSVCDILLHVVNHSTYHRAQIARLMRLQGEDAPASDYIFYKRQSR
ncbi:MAG: DinB family protein [Cyclobacteriaceae bacterium]